MIKEGKREPSKSEFDEDYVENLRSLKKQGEITEFCGSMQGKA